MPDHEFCGHLQGMDNTDDSEGNEDQLDTMASSLAGGTTNLAGDTSLDIEKEVLRDEKEGGGTLRREIKSAQRSEDFNGGFHVQPNILAYTPAVSNNARRFCFRDKIMTR